MSEKNSISDIFGGDIKTYIVGAIVAGYIGVDRFTPLGHKDDSVEELKKKIEFIEQEAANCSEHTHKDIRDLQLEIERLKIKHENG